MKMHRLMLNLHWTLRVAALLVPLSKRQDWRNEWIAELTYLLGSCPQQTHHCTHGMIADAVTIRKIDVSNRLQSIDRRSPENCLRILSSAFLLSLTVSVSEPALRGLVFSSWGAVTSSLFLFLAIFTVPCAFVLTSFSAYEAYVGDAAASRQRIRRSLFLGLKLLLVVLSSYLLAVEVTYPLYKLIGSQTNYALLLLVMVSDVVVIRWALEDQRNRCPSCLRLLKNPARIGPTSWSFLGSCNVEVMCDRGHGLLHQPMWRTSWFRNARWLQLDSTWRELFRL